MRKLSDLVPKGMGGGNGSKKTQSYFDKIFGTDLDFTFDEESQVLNISSAYKGLKLSNWSIIDTKFGESIVAGFSSDTNKFLNVKYFLGNPVEECPEKPSDMPESVYKDTVIDTYNRKMMARGISIINLIEATLRRSLTSKEKDDLGGNTIDEWVLALQKITDNGGEVELLLEFQKEEGYTPYFRVVSGVKNISPSGKGDLVFKDTSLRTFTILEKEGETTAKATTYSTPEIPANVTADSDLPF